MIVLNVRNAHEGLYKGILHLKGNGIEQDSRNGKVIRAETAVTTVYEKPMERVVFWDVRNANPFFHTYEALWMLAGRNDVRSVARYAKNMMNYSDDGVTLHDAYGFRWRKWFVQDQLQILTRLLRDNPLDRQCVLAMWDPMHDLGRAGKAVPCNLIATFTVDPIWKTLDLTVFCRSNDIIWGTYGANAVHFGFLLEYMSLKTGIPVGKYTQISINYHAYEEPYKKCLPVLEQFLINDYPLWIPMAKEVDALIPEILECADNFTYWSPKAKMKSAVASIDRTSWGSMMHRMMWAHQYYKAGEPETALHILGDAPSCDWILAGQEWIHRRMRKDVYADLNSGSTLEGA